MSISTFFVLSPRGDTIISKDFRGDIPAGSAEAFFRKVLPAAAMHIEAANSPMLNGTRR
jgi:hypothetical protein